MEVKAGHLYMKNRRRREDREDGMCGCFSSFERFLRRGSAGVVGADFWAQASRANENGGDAARLLLSSFCIFLFIFAHFPHGNVTSDQQHARRCCYNYHSYNFQINEK